MQYSKEFFDLQIRFAQKVAAVLVMPVEKALLDYTNLYIRFALGRDFDQYHPAWRRYLIGLSQSADMLDWTYQFYLTGATSTQIHAPIAKVGCFSYVMQHAECVRIHFDNIEAVTVSPLSVSRLPMRRDELRLLFNHVRRNQLMAKRVVGTSWLYNLPAYRRCFPHQYVSSGNVAESRFRNMSLWGQFLDRHGGVRGEVADDFLQRLSHAGNLQELAHCFPLQALAVAAPLAQFYAFYDVR